ncbi:alkane 1-monooxygenase [Roseivivax sp. GX 12232]|uniref:alkane 1-monooxygenase n=1 Tax=Roseivivax sp. GX 12232 TaxID=2900547 RepID=UPI001E4E68C4|nr:alkane 1-monooxygenase [Roseivivax sp. GX 12232]MCE0505147.1 alkane 1-monooxygenase [Roseivivax sp. GX 12232]
MARFTLITLSLVALLALGVVFGGALAWAALAYITLVAFFLDRLGALAAPDAPEGAEFPAGLALSVTLGVLHFPLLFGGALALAAGGRGLAEAAALFFGLALFLGQVSMANAHELIHRPGRGPRALGVAVYVSLLFGHHASAHRLVHHVHAATKRDPNSARLGEGFWRFALRAWRGSFRAGYRAEAKRAARAGRPSWRTPYALYLGGGLVAFLSVLAAGGWRAALIYGALCLYAQLQLLLSDYVQHYGLRRRPGKAGRPEPMGARHSWNAPQGFSGALMLNAPRHSDHHAHPGRAYPGLRLDRAEMPILPQSLPVMAVIALVPPVWRRMMDRRARAWR